MQHTLSITQRLQTYGRWSQKFIACTHEFELRMSLSIPMYGDGSGDIKKLFITAHGGSTHFFLISHPQPPCNL